MVTYFWTLVLWFYMTFRFDDVLFKYVNGYLWGTIGALIIFLFIFSTSDFFEEKK